MGFWKKIKYISNNSKMYIIYKKSTITYEYYNLFICSDAKKGLLFDINESMKVFKLSFSHFLNCT